MDDILKRVFKDILANFEWAMKLNPLTVRSTAHGNVVRVSTALRWESPTAALGEDFKGS